MKRLSALSVAFASAFTVLAACSEKAPNASRPASPADSAPRPAATPSILKVGYIPVTHCLPLFVAMDRGYFRAEGIEVQLVSLPGGAKILEALASRNVDIGFSNVVSAMLARQQGFPFVGFTGGPVEDSTHRDHAIMVPNGSRIRRVADLRGKRIALNARRNIDHVMLLLLLEKYGLKETDVTIQEVPFPRMLSVMSSGSVDAVAIAEPFVAIGRAQGARVLTWNYIDVQPRTFVSTYVTRADLVQGRAADLRAFHRALERAINDIEAQPAHARSVLATELKLDSVVARQVGLPRFVPVADSANILRTAVTSKRFGLLPAESDPAALVRGLLAGGH